jgi:hypothetical protein
MGCSRIGPFGGARQGRDKNIENNPMQRYGSPGGMGGLTKF